MSKNKKEDKSLNEDELENSIELESEALPQKKSKKAYQRKIVLYSESLNLNQLY